MIAILCVDLCTKKKKKKKCFNKKKKKKTCVFCFFWGGGDLREQAFLWLVTLYCFCVFFFDIIWFAYLILDHYNNPINIL